MVMWLPPIVIANSQVVAYPNTLSGSCANLCRTQPVGTQKEVDLRDIVHPGALTPSRK